MMQRFRRSLSSTLIIAAGQIDPDSPPLRTMSHLKASQDRSGAPVLSCKGCNRGIAEQAKELSASNSSCLCSPPSNYWFPYCTVLLLSLPVDDKITKTLFCGSPVFSRMTDKNIVFVDPQGFQPDRRRRGGQDVENSTMPDKPDVGSMELGHGLSISGTAF
jgi:hypothetical protein